MAPLAMMVLSLAVPQAAPGRRGNPALPASETVMPGDGRLHPAGVQFWKTSMLRIRSVPPGVVWLSGVTQWQRSLGNEPPMARSKMI
jgi:hypothetical protein